MIRKEQVWYLAGAILLLAILYFGFDNKPSTQKALEKSRAITTKEFDISSLQTEAKSTLSEADNKYLEVLLAQLEHSEQDSGRLILFQQLSGFWFRQNNPLLAGMYAREAALSENTGDSWSIAGTTFSAAFQQAGLDEKKKVFARNEALAAFENAISLQPAVIDHRVNQALCYVEVPDSEQPMKGIQMMAGLADTYPGSALPPYHLARLAMQTGQTDRALTRIEQALKLAPDESRILCLAAEIYKAAQRSAEAVSFQKKCESATKTTID